MSGKFKKVPAVEKCFRILNLLAETGKPMGISEIAKILPCNKSTVSNTLYTLCELEILRAEESNTRFWFGTNLYLLGKAARKGSQLIQAVHPFLEKINTETKLSAFLGIRSALNAIIIDKVDSAFDMKISSEVGMRMPLLAGAGGKALLSQLSDSEIDRILAENELNRFTPLTWVDKIEYKKAIMQVREEGIAFDREEYIEGIITLAVPLKTQKRGLQAAIWAMGLRWQVAEKMVSEFSRLLKGIAAEINLRISLS